MSDDKKAWLSSIPYQHQQPYQTGNISEHLLRVYGNLLMNSPSPEPPRYSGPCIHSAVPWKHR